MARKAGRTKPMSPKAGVTKTRRRYGCGGKVSKNYHGTRKLLMSS